MSDKMTVRQRSECMSHIHSKDTVPELIVRRELFRRGYRYRLNVRTLPGTPDIVLPRCRTVIFVNGCFWHGHKGCPKFVMPKTNVKFWRDKITRNQERDLLSVQRLESLTWSVITIWECELAKADISSTIDRVEAELKVNETKWMKYREKLRNDRSFAHEQARKHREILARAEAELDALYRIPVRIRRISREEEE